MHRASQLACLQRQCTNDALSILESLDLLHEFRTYERSFQRENCSIEIIVKIKIRILVTSNGGVGRSKLFLRNYLHPPCCWKGYVGLSLYQLKEVASRQDHKMYMAKKAKRLK